MTKKAENLYKSLILICKRINLYIDEGYILIEGDVIQKGKFVFESNIDKTEGIFFAYNKNISSCLLLNSDTHCIYGKDTFYQECKECFKELSKYKLINPKDAISVV